MWSNMRQLYIAQILSSCAKPWNLFEAQLVLEEIQCGSCGKCASKRPHTWHTSALRNRFIKSSLHFVFGIMKIVCSDDHWKFNIPDQLNNTLFRRHWIWSTFLLIVFLETTFHIAYLVNGSELYYISQPVTMVGRELIGHLGSFKICPNCKIKNIKFSKY